LRQLSNSAPRLWYSRLTALSDAHPCLCFGDLTDLFHAGATTPHFQQGFFHLGFSAMLLLEKLGLELT
jgi:hypothetical protein